MELDKACNNLNNVEQVDSELSREQHIESELNNVEEIDSKIEGFVQVSETSYVGLNTDNIETTVDNKQRTISSSIVQTQYKTRLEFPSVGSEKLIYVDLSDNSLWRFDTMNLKYICVGRDYEGIDVINGGNA